MGVGDWIDLAQDRHPAGSCEIGNGPLGSLKLWKTLDYLRTLLHSQEGLYSTELQFGLYLTIFQIFILVIIYIFFYYFPLLVFFLPWQSVFSLA